MVSFLPALCLSFFRFSQPGPSLKQSHSSGSLSCPAGHHLGMSQSNSSSSTPLRTLFLQVLLLPLLKGAGGTRRKAQLWAFGSQALTWHQRPSGFKRCCLGLLGTPCLPQLSSKPEVRSIQVRKTRQCPSSWVMLCEFGRGSHV